jgi:hypothetical protein
MVKMRIGFKDAGSITIQVRQDMTPTTSALIASIPFSSIANAWGDEVYFNVPFHAEVERDARAEMNIGDVAFWPDGDAVAIFFGRTPASVDDKPRAYSPCNLIGRLEGDISVLKRVKAGDSVEVVRE